MQKMSANDTPQTTVLVLATLDEMTQIEVTQIVLHHPMWSKQNIVVNLQKNFPVQFILYLIPLPFLDLSNTWVNKLDNHKQSIFSFQL
jgi:hypothetical protein